MTPRNQKLSFAISEWSDALASMPRSPSMQLSAKEKAHTMRSAAEMQASISRASQKRWLELCSSRLDDLHENVDKFKALPLEAQTICNCAVFRTKTLPPLGSRRCAASFLFYRKIRIFAKDPRIFLNRRHTTLHQGDHEESAVAVSLTFRKDGA